MHRRAVVCPCLVYNMGWPDVKKVCVPYNQVQKIENIHENPPSPVKLLTLIKLTLTPKATVWKTSRQGFLLCLWEGTQRDFTYLRNL